MTLNPQAPAELERIIITAVEKDREDSRRASHAGSEDFKRLDFGDSYGGADNIAPATEAGLFSGRRHTRFWLR